LFFYIPEFTRNVTEGEEPSRKKQKTVDDQHELLAEGTFLISLDSYSSYLNTEKPQNTDSSDSIVTVASTSTHSQCDTKQKIYSLYDNNYVHI